MSLHGLILLLPKIFHFFSVVSRIMHLSYLYRAVQTIKNCSLKPVPPNKDLNSSSINKIPRLAIVISFDIVILLYKYRFHPLYITFYNLGQKVFLTVQVDKLAKNLGEDYHNIYERIYKCTPKNRRLCELS